MTAKNELISMQHFIGGEWTDAENAAVFDDFNPLDDSLYGRAAKGTSADMQSAIAAARGAFPAYKASLPLERERWLLRVAELMEERQKELVDRSFADQAQTSRGLADLERTGIVRSLPSGEDRRVKNFELTEEGRREVEAAMPAIVSYFSQIDQSLNDEEKATLIALLDRVLEAAQNSEQPPQG